MTLSNDGGGGERVLWCFVRAVMQKYPTSKIIIFTGPATGNPNQESEEMKQIILQKAKDRFGISIEPKSIEFVFLSRRNFVEDKM